MWHGSLNTEILRSTSRLFDSLSYISILVVEGEFAAIKPVEDKHYLDFVNVPENEEDYEEVPDELLVVDYVDKNIDPETESFDPGPEDIFEKLNPKLDELAPMKEDILPEEEEETENQKGDFEEVCVSVINEWFSYYIMISSPNLFSNIKWI